MQLVVFHPFYQVCVAVFVGHGRDSQVHTDFKDMGEPLVLVAVTLGE